MQGLDSEKPGAYFVGRLASKNSIIGSLWDIQ